MKNILTKRELEILPYLAEGNTSKEISGKLFISKETVDKHRKNMLRKTNAKNSTALLMLYNKDFQINNYHK